MSCRLWNAAGKALHTRGILPSCSWSMPTRYLKLPRYGVTLASVPHRVGVRRVVGEYVRSTLGLFSMRVVEAIEREEERERAVRKKLSRPFEGD